MGVLPQQQDVLQAMNRYPILKEKGCLKVKNKVRNEISKKKSVSQAKDQPLIPPQRDVNDDVNDVNFVF